MAGFTPAEWQDAWLAAFRTAWGGSALVTPVAWPNLPFEPKAAFPDPAPTDAWVRAVVLQPPEGQTPIGRSGYYFREGTVGFEVYVRAETGTARSLSLAEALVAFLEYPDVAETAVRQIGVADVGSDGTWWQTNVSATFRYVTHRGSP